MTTSTTTAAQTIATAEFRKGRNGQWVVYGPLARVRVGQVLVRKSDGSWATATVTRVVAATTPGMLWGELAAPTAPIARSAASRHGRRDSACKDPSGDGYVNCLCRDCYTR